MNVVESRRVRHLVLRAEHGEALPDALARGLDEAEVKAGWVSGTGILEMVELASVDPGRARLVRRIEGAVMAVALLGSVAAEGGETTVRLQATLTREGPLGLETFAGELVSARVIACDLLVTALDDLSLGRQVDEQTGMTALVVSARAQASALRPVVTEPVRPTAPIVTPPPANTPAPVIAQAPVITPPPVITPAPVITPPPVHVPVVMQSQSSLPMEASAPGMSPPMRPVKPREEQLEAYPEIGDLVNHFHFGECEVISSDGERIRLRQDKDSRVREVALTMLKIESPTLSPTGKRHFRLARKH